MPSRKKVKKRMRKLYGDLTIDWMGYELTSQNFLTRHHIIKKSDCHPYSNNKINNSAFLGRVSHDLLHVIVEQYYPVLYERWKKLFFEIVACRQIDDRIMNKIIELRRDTEYYVMTDEEIPQEKKKTFIPFFLLDDPRLKYMSLLNEYDIVYDGFDKDDVARKIIVKRARKSRQFSKREN